MRISENVALPLPLWWGAGGFPTSSTGVATRAPRVLGTGRAGNPPERLQREAGRLAPGQRVRRVACCQLWVPCFSQALRRWACFLGASGSPCGPACGSLRGGYIGRQGLCSSCGPACGGFNAPSPLWLARGSPCGPACVGLNARSPLWLARGGHIIFAGLARLVHAPHCPCEATTIQPLPGFSLSGVVLTACSQCIYSSSP